MAVKALTNRIEYVIAGVAFAVVGVMVPWWAFFARRLIAENMALRSQLAHTPLDLSAEGNRLHFMLTTEFAAMALALATAVAALVYISRQRTLAQRRMEQLLQFTSHELKTPIAGVRALLQSLGLGSLPAERQAEFIARGLLEVDRLEHLTESILAWQRSLASMEAMVPTVHDTTSLVGAILEHRRRTGVHETLEVRDIAPAHVLADADAFRVILENLLDNAHKYGNGHAQVGAEVRGKEWVITIRDDGRGFRSADAEALFDPFRRQSHEGVTHGSGLGLYLSRQLAQRMRGRLTASSEGEGRGAAFSVALPVSGDPGAEAPRG